VPPTPPRLGPAVTGWHPAEILQTVSAEFDHLSIPFLKRHWGSRLTRYHRARLVAHDLDLVLSLARLKHSSQRAVVVALPAALMLRGLREGALASGTARRQPPTDREGGLQWYAEPWGMAPSTNRFPKREGLEESPDRPNGAFAGPHASSRSPAG